MPNITKLAVVLAASSIACNHEADPKAVGASAQPLSSEGQQASETQPAVYGTIKKPKERPVSDDQICEQLCRHAETLECGQGREPCVHECQRGLTSANCQDEVRSLHVCQSQQPDSAFRCDASGRVQAVEHCPAEQRELTRCQEREPAVP